MWEDERAIHTFSGRVDPTNNCFLIYIDGVYIRIHHCSDLETPTLFLPPEVELEKKMEMLAKQLVRRATFDLIGKTDVEKESAIQDIYGKLESFKAKEVLEYQKRGINI